MYMARETKKEALKRRKRVLFQRFRGTKWEEIFDDGLLEGDPEIVKEEKERLKKLEEEFLQEYGDLLKIPVFKWKKYMETHGEGLTFGIDYIFETVVGNQRFRLYFKDFYRRGKCDVRYAVRRKRRWKDMGYIGNYVWKKEAIELIEEQILLGEDKVIKK